MNDLVWTLPLGAIIGATIWAIARTIILSGSERTGAGPTAGTTRARDSGPADYDGPLATRRFLNNTTWVPEVNYVREAYHRDLTPAALYEKHLRNLATFTLEPGQWWIDTFLKDDRRP